MVLSSTLFRSGPDRFSILFLAVTLLSSVSQSQQGFLENGNPHLRGSDCGFLLDSPTRMKLDLSGSWSYLRDNGQTGTVQVPSTYDFDGKVTFERKFAIAPEQLDTYQYHLVMFGVNHTAEIAINGEFVAGHNGGYTSFVQPIQANALLIGADNQIKVTVTNHLDPRKTLPLRPGVWGVRNYGGIQRDVFLLATPLVYVKDVVPTTELDEESGACHLNATVIVDGPDPSLGNVKGIAPGKLSCVLEVFEKISGQLVQRSDPVPLRRAADGWEPTTLEVNIEEPKLWSPETPDLYLVKCFIINELETGSIVVDEYDLNVGVRSLDVHNGDFFLNGKRMILKGVVWYEDHPVWGSSLPYEQMERDVVLMKNLGANAVRFAHHPPHPYMLNLCDRYGLLALLEISLDAPGPVLADEGFLELASTEMKEIVHRDRSHACVLAWGVGGGLELGSAVSRRCIETLAHQTRELDSRPVYFVARASQGDECSDLVDFVALDPRQGDTKNFKAELEEWRSRHGDRPLVVLQLGSEVQHDNKKGYSDPFSQQAQARYFLQRLDLLRSLDYDGSFVWSFNDWRGDRPALTVHSGDPYLHSMGLVDGQREKRIAYDAVRSVFQNEKFVALPSGNTSTAAPIIYVLSGFVLLVGLAYLYNANRRFRESLNRSLLNLYNFFADVRDQRAVTLFHTTLLGLIVAAASAIVLSSILLHFRESLFLDNLLSLLLIADWVKLIVVKLIWDPLRFILIGGLVLFGGMLLVAVLVVLLRALMKTRVFPYHAYVVVVWSGAPLIVLIPVGMILFRIMESNMYVLPVLALFVLLHFWVFLRFLKGLSIVFDARPVKVYIVGVVTALVVVGGLYLYYDFAASAPMYVSFWYHTLVLGG